MVNYIRRSIGLCVRTTNKLEFALGYIPLDKDENDSEDADEDFYKHHVNPNYVDYFC